MTTKFLRRELKQTVKEIDELCDEKCALEFLERTVTFFIARFDKDPFLVEIAPQLKLFKKGPFEKISEESLRCVETSVPEFVIRYLELLVELKNETDYVRERSKYVDTLLSRLDENVEKFSAVAEMNREQIVEPI